MSVLRNLPRYAAGVIPLLARVASFRSIHVELTYWLLNEVADIVLLVTEAHRSDFLPVSIKFTGKSINSYDAGRLA